MDFKFSAEDEAFIAEVPELPGCAADGRTYQEALNQAEIVRQFASVFSQKYGIQFEIEEDAIGKIIERARETQTNVTDFCDNLFKDYPYGLKLLRDRDTNLKFTVPASAIGDPDKFLSERVVDFYRQAKEAEPLRRV